MTTFPKKRITKQKNLVYNILASTKTHPTADWIYEEARMLMPNISLGTIYRNLHVLANEGKIQELNCDGNQKRFDANSCLHYHFVCKECGAVIDCDIPALPLKENFYNILPGQCDDYRMEFYGTCSQWLNKKNN